MNLLSVMPGALFSEPAIEISLSRRNLRALLAKLDGHPKGSSATLYRNTERGLLIVHAEEDEVHYRRAPGRMDPETEAVMAGKA